MTTLFRGLFPKPKPIIAMVHVFEEERQLQLDQALEDAERLRQGGVDGLLVENYGWGYLNSNQATDETAQLLADITVVLAKPGGIPVGINVLPNDYWKSFLVAVCSGARFIQMDHVTGDFDMCEPVDPREFHMTRECYPNIVVFGGIHPKYYELDEPTCSLAECAKKAMTLADGVVVTGQVTGDAATLEDLRMARNALGTHPLIVGSGLTHQNAREQLAIADGAIVGTSLKDGGVRPGNRVSIERVQALMEEVVKLR